MNRLARTQPGNLDDPASEPIDHVHFVASTL